MQNTTTVAIALLFVSGGQAIAQGCQYSSYNHNGSQMRAERCADALRIHYENPKASIAKLGVKSGTLLFDGFVTLSNGIEFIEGQARVFKAGCGPAEFRVEGGYTNDTGRIPPPIYLAGVAPVRAANCSKKSSRNETLDFN